MFIGLFTKGFSWTNITKMMADLIEFMIKCFPFQEELGNHLWGDLNNLREVLYLALCLYIKS